ncbi:MAG: hypothetical protein PWP65_368 [Clostridia bacterium]|nr:hypothetical protein [Clostridia bacterium]
MKTDLPGNFTPCGIGSLPYREPGPALKLIRECLPAIPHWPQLPLRGHEEHFLFQSLAPLIRLGLIKEEEGAMPYFTALEDGWTERLTAFYGFYLQLEEGGMEALSGFSIPERAAVGFYAFLQDLEAQGTGEARFLKGQVAGPVTAGLYLTDGTGRPAFYEPQLRDLLVKTTALQARWQIQQLSRFGLPVIIFVDDPAISAYGTSGHVAIQWQDLVEALKEIAGAIIAGGGIPGVHSCSGVEWPIFFEAGYRIVSLDAYNFFTSLLVFASEVKTFLKEGGVLAWGLVPTYEQAWKETPMSLSRRLEEYFEALARRGVPGELLLKQALITPTCGTGTLEPELAEHIYRLTAELAGYLQQNKI